MASSFLHLFFISAPPFLHHKVSVFSLFCVTTQNTKGEVYLKQNRSYPGFLVFLPRENVGEANRAPSFQSWQTSSQSRYPNIYSAVEFVMNVTWHSCKILLGSARNMFKNKPLCVIHRIQVMVALVKHLTDSNSDKIPRSAELKKLPDQMQKSRNIHCPGCFMDFMLLSLQF